jgi:hypothetical protein
MKTPEVRLYRCRSPPVKSKPQALGRLCLRSIPAGLDGLPCGFTTLFWRHVRSSDATTNFAAFSPKRNSSGILSFLSHALIIRKRL